MKRLIGKLKTLFLILKKPKQQKETKSYPNRKSKRQDYFVLAKSWADDIYTETIASRNRYKIAFYWTCGITSLLIILLTMLIPFEHTELVVVHHYDDGTVWVEPTHQAYAPINKAQVENEIVRYVINRESYSSASYDEQYSLITLLSNNEIAKQYADEQSFDNKSSPISLLGNHGYRKAHIDNVVFLGNSDFQKRQDKTALQSNLAQVSFRITDYDKITGHGKSVSLTALISWRYRGTPKNPEDMWRNWDGFTVTHYDVEQRNV